MFENNRKRFLELINDNSLVILFSGIAPHKLGDEDYPFTPNRNFYYLTGFDKQGAILLLSKDVKTIFVKPYDEFKAKWVSGLVKYEEVKQITKIDSIKDINTFKSELASIIFNKGIENIYLDLENRYFDKNSLAIDFANEIKSSYPYINIKNCYNIFSELRTVKQDYEIKNIKKAISITKDGIYEMMKNAKPKMYEYEIESYFDFILKKNGVKHKAFETIAASGKNATILHYSDNNTQTKDGDLILFDVGATFNYYSGDITRTFPVNGRFTERQKEIYNIVLKGQKIIIDMIKPGVEFKALNEKLKDFYKTELKKINLIKEDDEVSKYYYHGVSHLLGLETHDIGRHNEGLLKEGMVLTVEPGLYIEQENIGIRIEDNVLVTKNGNEVLSKDIIKEIDDIEKFMEAKND